MEDLLHGKPISAGISPLTAAVVRYALCIVKLDENWVKIYCIYSC